MEIMTMKRYYKVEILGVHLQLGESEHKKYIYWSRNVFVIYFGIQKLEIPEQYEGSDLVLILTKSSWLYQKILC